MKRDWDSRAKHHAQYWIATEDFQDDLTFSQSGQQTAETLLTTVAPYYRATWSVLDIGCGIGRVLKPLARHFHSLVGIDVSGEMIERSKDWLRGIDNVQTVETSGVDLSPFPPDHFDLVYSYVAFQHMPRPVFAQYLEESNRVLKPQGYFAFQIPIGSAHDAPLEDTIALRHYTMNELIEYLDRCGLQLIEERDSPSHASSAKENQMVSSFLLAQKVKSTRGEHQKSWLQTECGEIFSSLDTRMWLWFAERCLQEGREEEALYTYHALREHDPLSLEKWSRVVDILIEAGKIEEAKVTLEKLKEAILTYEKLNHLWETHNPVIPSIDGKSFPLVFSNEFNLTFSR